MTTLVCHVGGPKCGSSAIQAALHRNRALLHRHGVHVPLDPRQPLKDGIRPRKGNGARLARYLCGGPGTPADASALWDLDGARIVLSSEDMHRLTPDRLDALLDHLARIGAEIAVIYYMRSVADKIVASRAQAARRGKGRSRFKPRSPGYAAGLRTLLSRLPAETVDVRSYDAAAGALFDDFFGAALGLPPDLVGALDLDLPPTNPSLKGRQILMAEHLAPRLGDPAACEAAADLLIATTPPGAVTITPEVAARLPRFQAEIDYVNAHMRNGAIALRSDRVAVSDEMNRPLSPEELALCAEVIRRLSAREDARAVRP